MAQTIQIRRGLQANVAAATLATGEIVFTTDTGMVYVYDGSAKQLIGRVLQGVLASRPSFGVSGRMYFSTDTGDMSLDTGSAWVNVGVNDLASMTGDLDDISDGTNFQRVAATEVDANGNVTQINDGTNTVTAAQGRSHINSTSNPHSVTAAQVGISSLDDVSDGSSFQRVAAAEVDANGRVTQINDGTNSVTALQGRTHIDSTANPHSTSIANVGSGTIAELNTAISDGTVGAGLNDSGATSSDLWSASKIQNVVDSNASGLSWKAPVDIASTADLTLSGEQTIDGVLTSASRILVKDQTAAAENGIYVTAAGAWSRATDMDVASEFDSASVFVSNGTANADTGFVQTSTVATVDTDAVTFVQFTGAGQVTAGTGLSKSGNTIDANLGAGITALPTDEIGIDLASTSGLELTSALTAGQLQLSAQGNGIAGGVGSVLSVNADSTTGVTVAPVSVVANGVGVTVDNSSIVHAAGTLAVSVVDGGTF